MKDKVKTEESKEEITVPEMKGIEPGEGDGAYVKGEFFIFRGGKWRNVKDLDKRRKEEKDGVWISSESVFDVLTEPIRKIKEEY